MNKTEFTRAVAEQSGWSLGDIRTLLATMETVAARSLKKGDFVVVGDLARLTVRKKPATKAGMFKNPFTGEMQHRDAKPASKAVRASVPKRLKDKVN